LAKIGLKNCTQDERVSEFANCIVVICEAPADYRVAQGFAERVLTEKIEWLKDVPKALPKWCGLQLHEMLLAWKNVN
jgi:hypothetical protein